MDGFLGYLISISLPFMVGVGIGALWFFYDNLQKRLFNKSVLESVYLSVCRSPIQFADTTQSVQEVEGTAMSIEFGGRTVPSTCGWGVLFRDFHDNRYYDLSTDVRKIIGYCAIQCFVIGFIPLLDTSAAANTITSTLGRVAVIAICLVIVFYIIFQGKAEFTKRYKATLDLLTNSPTTTVNSPPPDVEQIEDTERQGQDDGAE